MTKQQPIPVTVITGFLGTGKTSLLNQLLRRNAALRFAIIENEFGEVGIDGQLTQANSQSSVWELNNGCICCSLNNELGLTLNRLIMAGLPFDHLLIEATGVADPAEIIQTFVQGTRASRYYRLNSVVCLVDASQFADQLNRFDEARFQLAHADVVLLNKTDLVTPRQLHAVQELVHAIKPDVQMYHTQYGQLNEPDLLAIDAFDARTVSHNVGQFSAPVGMVHKHKLQSVSVTVAGSFHMEQFSFWMEDFLFLNRNKIFRTKGILCIDGLTHKLVLQGIKDRFTVEQGDALQPDQAPSSQLVFIGEDIPADNIREMLQALTAKTARMGDALHARLTNKISNDN